MKILWFASTPCGATEKLTGQKVIGGGWLYSLSEALKSQKEVELHIAFYWSCRMESFEYDGITYHPILRKGFGCKIGRYIYRLKQQFSTTLDSNEIERCLGVYNAVQPDLVHFHGSEENYGLLAQRIDNRHSVLSIQGILSSINYKTYSGFQRRSILKAEPFVKKIILDGYASNDRKMKLRVKREQTLLKSIPHIIGRTSWDRDCSLLLNPYRVYYYCNESLRAEFINNMWNVQPITIKLSITTAISCGIFKGLEMVYESAKLLTNAGFDFEWNVIGIAPNDAYAKMTEMITGISPNNVHVHLLGRKNANQMIVVFKRSHCFVQVSHIENSPNSLCEAMILGMPIIASYAGGTSSMLQDGVEGTLVQDGDPYRLAGAIMFLKNDYPHAVRMGQAARTRAHARHNPGNVVNELLNAYKSILRR